MNLKNKQIVYFPNDEHTYINLGVTDKGWENEESVFIDYIEFKETRVISSEYIKPTPIDQFHTEQEWHKLPKHWDLHNDLFTISYDLSDEDRKKLHNIRYGYPDEIMDGLREGVLVPAIEKFRGEVNTEIDHDRWRVYKRYPNWTLRYGMPSPIGITKNRDEVFDNYSDAKTFLNKYLEDKKSEEEMTDLEWSIEQIKKCIKKHTVCEEDADAIWNLVKDFSRLEDLDFRFCNNKFQYKYFPEMKEWKDLCSYKSKDGHYVIGVD